MKLNIFIFFIISFVFYTGCATQRLKFIDDTKSIDETHKTIEEGWNTFNIEVDRFFAHGSFEEETNKSYIRVNNIIEIVDGEGLGNDLDIRMQVDFPNTSKDVNFVLETKSDDVSGNLTSIDRTKASKTNRKKVSAAGRYRFKTKNHWSLYVDLGFEFTVPLDPFAKFRVRRRFKSRRYRLDLIQSIKYFRVERLEHETLTEYTYKFNRRNSIKNKNSFLYRWVDQQYSFYNTISWRRRLSSKKTLSYSVGANGVSLPTYNYTDYSISIGLREKAYKEWFFIEPVVGLNFSRENNFFRKGFVYLMFDAFL